MPLAYMLNFNQFWGAERRPGTKSVQKLLSWKTRAIYPSPETGSSKLTGEPHKTAFSILNVTRDPSCPLELLRDRAILGSVMSLADKYIREGHPTIDELVVEQKLAFPRDPHDLLGDFWPEGESIDDFLAAMHDWRGHSVMPSNPRANSCEISSRAGASTSAIDRLWLRM